MTDKEINELKKEFETQLKKYEDEMLEKDSIHIGEFLIWHAKIEHTISEFVTIFISDKVLKVNSYQSSINRLKIIKKLVPKSETLKIFELLDKLHGVRNKIVHKSEVEFNDVQDLFKLYKNTVIYARNEKIDIQSLKKIRCLF